MKLKAIIPMKSSNITFSQLLVALKSLTGVSVICGRTTISSTPLLLVTSVYSSGSKP